MGLHALRRKGKSTLIAGYTLRRATRADIDIIRHQRRAMFRAMGHADEAGIERMDAGFAPWLEQHLADGRYIGLFAQAHDGEVVAGAGIWLFEWPPTFLYPQRARAYLLNVYTEPAHRQHGLAHTLVRACIEECRERDVNLILLHASDEGRAVYASLGFQEGSEMRLFLKGTP
jgi:ribosomal protein S18 acetylase RimI-like enzyme